MAVESTSYWYGVTGTVPPPESWCRVRTPTPISIAKARQWCADADRHGEYCWTGTWSMEDSEGDSYILWAFSDLCVAMEFKLRFG